MASASGGGAGAVEAEKKSGNKRIVDYLNDGEDSGGEEEEAGAARLATFSCARLVRSRGKGGRSSGRAREVAVLKSDRPPVHSSGCETGSGASPCDIGVGLSLVFLLAKASVEFDKTVKLRAEMEMLLEEMKDQVRKNSTGHGTSMACHFQTTASSCFTDTNQSPSVPLDGPGLVTSPSMVVVISCDKSSEDEGCTRMDVLEEEFELELERLRFNLDTESPEQQSTESSDEFIDLERRFDDKLMEDIGDESDDDTPHSGVSAIELERRLHELLHQRNRERIAELELALRCVEKKLVEKEMETCLWKDTAKLALGHGDGLL